MKTLKTIFCITGFLTLIILSQWCFGQTSNLEEVIYLKNGSVIHGTIIEEIPGQSIKIKTYDGNVFVFKYEELEKITKEEIRQEENRELSLSSSQNDNRNSDDGSFVRYSFLAEGTYLFGIGNVGFQSTSYFSADPYKNLDHGYGLNTVHALQIGNHFSAGLSIGLDFYENLRFLPVKLDHRFYFGKGKVNPLLNVALGYSAPLYAESGGFTLSSKLGARIRTGDKSAFFLAIGYNLQRALQIVYPETLFNSDIYLMSTAHFISISSGYSF